MVTLHTVIEICCLVILRLQLLSAQDTPSLVKQQLHVDPSDATIVSGKSVTFACFATQHPVTLTWVKDAIYALAIDRFIVSPEKSRISISVNETRGSYELHIADVQPGDAGKYHCELAANLPSEHVASEPAKMTVIVLWIRWSQIFKLASSFEVSGPGACRCVADAIRSPEYGGYDKLSEQSTYGPYGISRAAEVPDRIRNWWSGSASSRVGKNQAGEQNKAR
eukprot:XP_011664139.1 PREDICTED: uncharacterized protein LOC105438249 [Strongylocentrotus purpuratus]